MEQLSQLQARISNLNELRDLIRALRALAAAHVKEANAALVGIHRYVEVIADAFDESACLVSAIDGEMITTAASGGSLLLLVCSEHGFVGSFNERLLDRAEEELGEGQRLGVIGARGVVLAIERGLQIDWSSPMATRAGGVLTITRPIIDRLMAIATADIVFAKYRAGGHFDVVKEPLLPLDPTLFIGSEPRNPPLHHLEPDVLLLRLAEEYLFAEVTRAVMESLTSENAARLRVMESANHNIEDKLQILGLQERTSRQEAITAELLDIVTGAEAVLGQPE
jgi:F-type H+-transporting ATPase subunit gamma